MSGEFKKTKNYYQVAAKYEPENLLFPYELSNFKKEILDSNLKSKIDKIIKEKKSTKKNLAYGNFLLSKYELKNRNYENEFNYLIKGHQYYFQSQGKAFAEGVNYCLNELPKIKELINLKSNSKKDYKIKPIFIVGVPRCGSTLVEKVIASGTKFIPIGEETSTINFFVDKIIIEKKSINLNIEKIKKEVIARYKNQGLLKKENDYIFTDKTLDNFFFIGLIKKIFPNAKVINCRRNSLASIMSIMKNNLVDVAWAHNLEHIFKFFDIYHRVTESFKKKFPNFIYEIEFEQFVSNPEIESKKLLKFCDLPWDIKCLEFYKRKDLVSRTASNIQIRKAIYKDSPDKYSFYKKFLYKYGKKYSWFK